MLDDAGGTKAAAEGCSKNAALEAGGSEAAEGSKIRLRVGICYLVCCCIWGTTWYAVRLSVEPGDGLPPNFAGAIRFLIAIILYLPILLIYSRRLGKVTRKQIAWIALAGLFNGLYQCFVYTAMCTISGGLGAVLMATSPLMVAAMAVFAGIEKVRKNTVIGFCLSLVGVALVCHDRISGASEQVVGIGLALIAAFFTSLSNITLKGRGTDVHPLASATIFLFFTDIPVWIGSFLFGEKAVLWPIPIAPMCAVVYMAVMSSIVAFLLYLYMLRHMSLMAISTLQFILPVLALVVDMFLEKRVSLTPQVWAGIAVVLSGVVISMRRH